MVAVLIPVILIILLFFENVAFAGYGSTLCKKNSEYTCYTVKRHDTWKRLFPDEDKRDLIMRINRMNTPLYPKLKIAIPKSEDLEPLDYSPLPKQIDPPGEKFIKVSIPDLAFGAYSADGNLEYWGPISAGRDFCPDVNRGCRTTPGKFKVYSKQGSGCISTKFPVGKGGAPMPYCMFYNKGYALHGSYKVPGYNDSHGCVRMFVNDAKWLNEEFIADEKRVRVIIER